ncbi:MAG: WGR domain-containing protein [Deltaproteobacteria bacterium]|nr:WGR domain-containing protein [Deltaproteobacteria bacterium]
MTRYELSDGKSHKFWEIERKGSVLRLRWGKIGTEGQALDKPFGSPALAAKEEQRLVAEKTKKGYVRKGGKAAKAIGAPVSAPVDERELAKPIGRVAAESNFLALVAVDGAHAGDYRFPFDEGGLDFEKTLDGPLPIGKGKGLFLECSSSGIADIHRFGDALVIADIATDEDDVDTEAEMLRALAGHPTTKAKRIGTVDVPSGVLVLMGQHHDGPKLDIAKIAKQSKPVKTPSGAAIPVPPGRYEIWRERFRNAPRGDWGAMDARTRIVPAGAKVLEGKPLVDLASAPAARAPSAGTHRLVDPKLRGWSHARTLSVDAEGRVFAGQDDGNAVAAWHANGTPAWHQILSKKVFAYSQVTVQRVGPDLLVLGALEKKLLVLDPQTGKKRRSLAIPQAEQFRVIADRLFVFHEEEARVFAYPSMKPLATLLEHRDSLQVDMSPDGRWVATSSSTQTHVYDAKTWKHLRSIEGDVRALAFDASSNLIIGSRKSAVRVTDPRTGKTLATFDAAPERGQKPAIEAIACTRKHLAISRVDGTTTVHDAKTRKLLKRFEKHTTKTYFGPPVTFSPDEAMLWVGACPKGKPAGVSGYAL